MNRVRGRGGREKKGMSEKVVVVWGKDEHHLHLKPAHLTPILPCNLIVSEG